MTGRITSRSLSLYLTSRSLCLSSELLLLVLAKGGREAGGGRTVGAGPGALLLLLLHGSHVREQNLLVVPVLGEVDHCRRVAYVRDLRWIKVPVLKDMRS
jgi:hypothetical protein